MKWLSWKRLLSWIPMHLKFAAPMDAVKFVPFMLKQQWCHTTAYPTVIIRSILRCKFTFELPVSTYHYVAFSFVFVTSIKIILHFIVICEKNESRNSFLNSWYSKRRRHFSVILSTFAMYSSETHLFATQQMFRLFVPTMPGSDRMWYFHGLFSMPTLQNGCQIVARQSTGR